MLRSCSGGALASRHPAESHPQVLIIAPIWDISYNCIKCGRALTNPNSQRHRVGTDCIKYYGSQARKIANPAHAAWIARKTKADVDRIAKQVEYDAEHARAMDVYGTAIQQWKAIRSGLPVPALDSTRR